MNGTCDWCNEQPADPRYREITGIEKLRDGGGANVIHARRETGKQICGGCVRKLCSGVPIGQGTLI